MKWNVRSRDRRGFTLVELVAVVVVMLLLVGVAAFGYTSVQRGVRSSAAKDVLRTIAASQQLHFDSRGSFASSSVADLQQVANNQPGYTANGNTAPTKPLQVSVSEGLAHGEVPVVSLATTVRGGTCVVLAAFPTDSGRDNKEGVFKKGEYSTCTGAAALTLLKVSEAPAAGSNLPAQVAWVTITRSPDSLKLSWNPVAGATGYKVYRMAPGESSFRQIRDVASTSFTDPGLAAAYSGAPAVYTYQVAAYNADGNGPKSPNASGTPGAVEVATVAAPRDLDVTADLVGGSNQLALSWRGDDATHRYRVLRNGQQVGTDIVRNGSAAPATSFVITGNAAERAYKLRVVAYASATDTTGAASSEVVGVTLPEAPVNVTAAAMTSAPGSANACTPSLCVQLGWSRQQVAASDELRRATSYRVYRCRVADGCRDQPWASNYTLSGTVPAAAGEYTFAFRDTGLESGAYRYTIVGVNEAGTAKLGASVDVSTVPGAVAGISAASTSPGVNVVSWTALAGATGYTIWAEDAAGNWSQAGTTNAGTTTWSHTVASNNDGIRESYRYRVSATTAAGAGNWSSAVSVRTRPFGPTLVATPNRDTAVITFPAAAHLSYDLYRDGSLYQSNVRSGFVDTVGWDTTRTYSLAARNVDGSTSTGAGVAATTVPAPVTRLPSVAISPSAGQDAMYTTVISGLPATDSSHAYRVYSCTTSALPACTSPAQLGQGAAGATTWSRSGTLSTTAFPRVGSTEYWAVALYNIATNKVSDVSTTFAVKQVPNTPANVTASYTTNGSLVLSWDSDNHATHFAVLNSQRAEVARVANNKTGGRTTVTLAKDDTADVTAAAPLYLASFNGAEDLHKTSRHVTVPVPSTSAIAPSVTALRAVSTATSLKLSWRAPGATSYRLLRCAGSCDPRTTTGSTSIAAATGVNAVNGGHDDTTAVVGSPFSYSVSVSKDGGATWSAWSTPATAAREVQPVTNLRATGRTSSTVSIAWTPAPSAAGYYVYVDGVLRDTVSTGTASAYTFNNLTAGVSYSFGIRTFVAGGTTSVLTSVPDYAAVDAPVLSGSLSDNNTQIRWTGSAAGPAAVSYRLLTCTGSPSCTPDTVVRDYARTELGGAVIYQSVPQGQISRYAVQALGQNPAARAVSNPITHRNNAGISSLSVGLGGYYAADNIQIIFNYAMPSGTFMAYRTDYWGATCAVAANQCAQGQPVSTNYGYWTVNYPTNDMNDTGLGAYMSAATPPGPAGGVSIGTWSKSSGRWQITFADVPGRTQFALWRSSAPSGGQALATNGTSAWDYEPSNCKATYYYRLQAAGPYGSTYGPWAGKVRGGC
jgi:prepilin-type N-terminal cleavage/methylation domain-containing protein